MSWEQDGFDELEEAKQGAADYLFDLVSTSIYSEEKKQKIERELWAGISLTRAFELTEQLRNDQPCPIASGSNYGTTEITKKLKDEMD